jgi:hypothetical protein
MFIIKQEYLIFTIPFQEDKLLRLISVELKNSGEQRVYNVQLERNYDFARCWIMNNCLFIYMEEKSYTTKILCFTQQLVLVHEQSLSDINCLACPIPSNLHLKTWYYDHSGRGTVTNYKIQML